MNYHRYFIPLTSDSKGFENGGKEPMGRCILEDRGNSGKLSLWVQDLKPQPQYKIMLILSDAGKYTGVSLGSLYVDGKGKGEFRNEFNSESLADGQGLPRVCAVAVMAGSGYELLCPLVGYKDGAVLWKNHFVMPEAAAKSRAESRLNTFADRVEAPKVPAADPHMDEPEKETKTLPDENTAADPDEHSLTGQEDSVEHGPSEQTDESDFDAGNNFRFYKEDYEPGEIGGAGMDGDLPREDIPEMGAQEPADYETLGTLKEIFDNNIEITPFEPKSPDEKWVRISVREPIYLPIDYRFLMNHPFVIAAYRQYSHMIMGRIIGEHTHYFLGVPDTYQPQYVNVARQIGFTQFKTVTDNAGLRPGEYGYWLAPLYI